LVKITTVKPRYAVAALVRLLARSPSRAEPFCPVFGRCGGCQLQHLDYAAQLRWKREVVRSALERIGGFAGADVRDTIGMDDPRAYRNKMSLVVDHRAALPRIGFYKQRSHDVVPIDACPIVEPQLSDYIERLAAARLDETTSEIFKAAKHILARSAQATGQAVITITSKRESLSVTQATALQALLPGAAGVTNSFDLSSENAILGRRHRVVSGSGEVEESIAGITYRISPRSFFQINVRVVARIFGYLKTLGLGPHLRIVDLYCGVGTFTLFFAKQGCDVFGIEENALAVDEGRKNAQRNRLSDKLRFRSGRVERVLSEEEGRMALALASTVFLDPPRKGSDEATLAAIAAARVASVWYLSCDPATLARDLKFLAAKGYRIGAVQPFDMFPQTGHVETFVALEHCDGIAGQN
jgi:23S rRNA (uracil1939-C5)-methyltransferase